MIERICPVHGVPMKGTKCTKEGCDAKLITSITIYWCPECNVPSFEKRCACCGTEGKYIATDIRPVFPEEKMLLAILLKKDSPFAFDNCSVWNSSSGYFIDGEKQTLSIKDINNMPLEDIKRIKDIYDENVDKIDWTYHDSMVEKFVEVNANRYYELTDEAISYIQSFEDKYSLKDMFVSFSGGKDSTVTSDLVTRAFATNKVIHIFGDTTLEFPTTYEYRARFAKEHRVIRAKNHEKNFEEMCEQIGPPSRVMRCMVRLYLGLTINKRKKLYLI